MLESPGYKIQYVSFLTCTWDDVSLEGSSMDDRTLVMFSDNPVSLLNAYADSGEGVDRAGGFAIQVCGANFDCV